MREGPEAIFAMIGTHTAFSKAAKSHFTGSQMNNRIIDASTSKTTPRSHFSCYLPVWGKKVQGKIEIAFSSEAELERLIAYMDGQDQTEDTEVMEFRV